MKKRGIVQLLTGKHDLENKRAAPLFLHIDDGAQHIEDEEGSELPDVAAAREEALRAARQLWAAAILERRDIGMRRFLIADAEGHIVATLNMDEALPRVRTH